MSQCQPSTLKKYRDRLSPPYPANKCQGQIKTGNDGRKYKSVPNKNNVHAWVLSDSARGSVSRKTSASRKTSRKTSRKVSKTSRKVSRNQSRQVSKHSKYLELTFVSYLLSDDLGMMILIRQKKLLQFVVRHKLPRIKQIVYGILRFVVNIKKYEFDPVTGLVTVTVLNEPEKFAKFSKKYKDLKEHLVDFYGEAKIKGREIGQAGPDTWMSGDISLIDQGEYDAHLYEFGISFLKMVEK